MYRTSNPVADAECYSADLDARLERLPVCSECGYRIQDEYAYYMNGEWICECCMDENYRREVPTIWE